MNAGVPKKLLIHDRLITRPQEALPSAQALKRPECCPMDPKTSPAKGQTAEAYARDIAYTA